MRAAYVTFKGYHTVSRYLNDRDYLEITSIYEIIAVVQQSQRYRLQSSITLAMNEIAKASYSNVEKNTTDRRVLRLVDFYYESTLCMLTGILHDVCGRYSSNV